MSLHQLSRFAMWQVRKCYFAESGKNEWCIVDTAGEYIVQAFGSDNLGKMFAEAVADLHNKRNETG